MKNSTVICAVQKRRISATTAVVSWESAAERVGGSQSVQSGWSEDLPYLKSCFDSVNKVQTCVMSHELH